MCVVLFCISIEEFAACRHNAMQDKAQNEQIKRQKANEQRSTGREEEREEESRNQKANCCQPKPFDRG